MVWGWGQVAAGDRRGWILPIVQLGAVAALVFLGSSAAFGTNAPFVFLAASIVLALWALIPVHAHRVAALRRAALDLPAGATGGFDLLWLSPLIVAFSTVFWSSAGRLGDPGLVLSDYVADWRAGSVDVASRRFSTPPADSAVADAWEAQLANLRNDLVRLAAVSGTSSGIVPEDPFGSVRWTPRDDAEPGTFTADVEVVRRESVRSQLFGLLPSTSQRLVTLEKLGSAELVLVDLPGQMGGQGWRIVRVEIEGIVVGG